MKTHKSVIFHTRVAKAPNDAIFIKFGTVVNLTYVLTKAKFGWHRLKGGHFAAVQNLPSSHDFHGWPYNSDEYQQIFFSPRPWGRLILAHYAA